MLAQADEQELNVFWTRERGSAKIDHQTLLPPQGGKQVGRRGLLEAHVD